MFALSVCPTWWYSLLSLGVLTRSRPPFISCQSPPALLLCGSVHFWFYPSSGLVLLGRSFWALPAIGRFLSYIYFSSSYIITIEPLGDTPLTLLIVHTSGAVVLPSFIQVAYLYEFTRSLNPSLFAIEGCLMILMSLFSLGFLIPLGWSHFRLPVHWKQWRMVPTLFSWHLSHFLSTNFLLV